MSARELADRLMAHVVADFDPDWAEKAAGLMEQAATALVAAAGEEAKRTQCCAALAEAQAELARVRGDLEAANRARQDQARLLEWTVVWLRWVHEVAGCFEMTQLRDFLNTLQKGGLPAATPKTDDELRAFWRSEGGSFHGPITETGTMSEAKLLPLLRRMMGTQP
ncbi:MAG: hypothetical protein RLZZ127_1513 [Planctomycetota bacterium]